MVDVPNYTNLFAQGAQAGQQQRSQRQRQQALSLYGTNPDQAENLLMAAGDVETANALTQRRTTQAREAERVATVQRRQELGGRYAGGDATGARQGALEAGDFELAQQFGALDDQARALAEEKNAKIGGVAYQLLQVKDPNQRQELAAKAIPTLVQQGVITEEMAGKVDLSDQSLQAYVGQAMKLKDIISQANSDREFNAGREDRGQDVQFREKQFGETVRSNRVGEGQRAQQIGISAGQLGLARQAEARQMSEAELKRTGKVRDNSMRIGSARNVIGTVDSALSKLGTGEAGLIGSTAAKIPGTQAYNLNRDVETIKANLGFEQLQAMREASPTGGALGQVAVQELIALQATLANLDIGQSERQLRANLYKVKDHYNKWLSTVEGAGGEAAPDPLGLR
jgi:hypothetical protein